MGGTDTNIESHLLPGKTLCKALLKGSLLSIKLATTGLNALFIKEAQQTKCINKCFSFGCIVIFLRSHN